MNRKFDPVIEQYDLDTKSLDISPLGSGLVHQTYFLKGDQSYVLQKINDDIFKQPELIAQNIQACTDFLKKNKSSFPFINFIPTLKNEAYARIEKTYWRLSPFIENSYTKDLLESPAMAFEAARAVGSFSKNFNSLNPSHLAETIPGFHDLNLRYRQFKEAMENGIPERILIAQKLISKCLAYSDINKAFENLKTNETIPVRIQHHDTKINNVLFDLDTNKYITLCDLDTVMPGYCISDLGDMIRTYTSIENEESTNWEKIKIRQDYYLALMEGYLSEMKEVLTKTEKELLFYAGTFLLYMQALRFLSDYLMGDNYYPVKHALHNFNRAKNQLILLDDLFGKKDSLEKGIERLLKA